MTDLIRADLRRILVKRNFQITLGVAALLALIESISDKIHFWNGFLYAVHQSGTLTGTVVTLGGLVIFLGLYADEFNAKSMQAAVGRGIPRARLIGVKFLECAALSALAFLCFFVFLLLLGVITGAELGWLELRILALSTLCGAYIVICTTPLAAFVLYATDNPAAATFVELFLTVILPAFLTVMESNLLIRNSHIRSWTADGFAECFFADRMLGGGGWGRLFLGAVLYLGLAYVLTVQVFRKKEMEL